MDHYSSQIIIDHRLQELRAQGAQARAARSARRPGTSVRARLATFAFGWRTRRPETTGTGQDRRPAVTRPA